MKEGKGQFTDELGNPEPIGERVGARVNVSQTRCAADKAEVPTNRGSVALRASTRGVGRSFGLVAPAVYACVIRDRCVSAHRQRPRCLTKTQETRSSKWNDSPS